MPVIGLPDGSQRQYDKPISVAEVAADIGPGLLRVALAGRVNGHLVDLTYSIDSDAGLSIVTDRDKDGLDIIRHSTAHLLAWAVKELFPTAQVTIGPVIEDGFYYDFACPPFTPEDFESIERKMSELARQDLPVQREVWQRDRAVAFFLEQGEKYKAELIAAIPDGEAVSLYRQGNFIDLCRGPHVPNTGRLKVFKLLKLAGAYWRGDSSNEMLQRIYGTAWAKKEELAAYLHQLEEAEKRDHRKIARQLDLFHTQDEAPGLVFWHPDGWTIWQIVEQYMRAVYRNNGYQEVCCPQILDKRLWEQSGHWEHYKDNMFTTESEKRDYAIKPMNCPGHVQIFNTQVRSYRDLPIRYGEFGSCHRKESSGALHGLLRLRGFVQDDGHIFCSEEQIEAEVIAFNDLVQNVYADFGFQEIAVKLALRPQQRVGDDVVWDQAETALRQALTVSNLEWEELPGEGAFYGPKIEFHIRDAIGRSWQCGTMQVDFSMSARLKAEYVDADDQRRAPVMLHRAVLGSMERFIGILLENHAGALPLWLAPIQAVVLSISEKHTDYARQVTEQLHAVGIRARSDLRNEKINYKIRQHSMQRIPYQLVVGDQEKLNQQVAVRARGGQNMGSMPLEQLIERLQLEVTARSTQN